MTELTERRTRTIRTAEPDPTPRRVTRRLPPEAVDLTGPGTTAGPTADLTGPVVWNDPALTGPGMGTAAAAPTAPDVWQPLRDIGVRIPGDETPPPPTGEATGIRPPPTPPVAAGDIWQARVIMTPRFARDLTRVGESVDVGNLVHTDIEARVKQAAKHSGHTERFKTNSGSERDALHAAYTQAIDLVLYLRRILYSVDGR